MSPPGPVPVSGPGLPGEDNGHRTGPGFFGWSDDDPFGDTGHRSGPGGHTCVLDHVRLDWVVLFIMKQ